MNQPNPPFWYQQQLYRLLRVLLVLVILILVASLNTRSYAATMIMTCSDGDLCWVNEEGIRFSFRIHGIDAPENDQPYGPEATQWLNSKLTNKKVDIKCKSSFLGKKTCDVSLNGQNIAPMMVQAGYAWDWPEYSYGQYKAYQDDAKANKVGLWADNKEEILSPYCWRNPSKSQCEDPSFQP